MLKGNVFKASVELRQLIESCLQEAYQEDNQVNWESEMNTVLNSKIFLASSDAMGKCTMAGLGLQGSTDRVVPYIKGRIPGTEVQEVIKIVQAMFREMYPNSTKTANRKVKTFKRLFAYRLRGQLSRWNNDSKAYYPNGRKRKDVDGIGAGG